MAFPDADFAGLCGFEKSNGPTCTKSRTGFLTTVSDCPVLLISKVQPESALSAMEAEINVLNHCCRKLFPVIDMITDVGTSVLCWFAYQGY